AHRSRSRDRIHAHEGRHGHEARAQHDHHRRDDPPGQDVRQSHGGPPGHERQARGSRRTHSHGSVRRDAARRADAHRRRRRQREDGHRHAQARRVARRGGGAARGGRRRDPSRRERPAAAGRMSIDRPPDDRRDEPQGAVIVGLMSGTSADGISAAAARFTPDADAGVHCTLLAYRARPYSSAERERLLRAVEGAAPAEYCRLDFDLGVWLADAALAVMADAGLASSDVRAIASHGHTVWHAPPLATWQMGQAAVITERTSVDVISDFRVRDVAAGGQGAPLVPMADALLFAATDSWRALQNLGGIGNVTVVPPRAAAAREVRAFDTGPGCAVIDGVTRALAPSLPYDVDGALARTGTPISEVVTDLLEDPYFSALPPKSTGR